MSEHVLQILVVEDDELDRRIMKKALIATGINHQLYFAIDHESGLLAAKEREYDCIFLDYNLPGGTGLELLKAIRQTDTSSPIVIVTSQGDEKLAVQAMKNGANDYIPKVLLSPEGVSQCIRYMVNLKKTEREQKILKRQLLDTQRRLQTVVANSPIILFALDKDAVFTLFEGKGLADMGIDKNEFIGLHLDSATMLPLSMTSFEKAIQGEEVTNIVQLTDRYFEIFYTATLDEKQQVSGVIGVASDITDHKRAEEELTKAKQMAEDTARIKEQFLANMSHEIRTPMNGIIGLTRILLESRLDEEQLKYLKSIKTCSDNLLVIINDILDFSKIEAGKMSFESVPFRLNEVIQNAVELFQVKADEKSIALRTEIEPAVPASISGDPTRLSQILNNLISNAIKFTEKGQVNISVKLLDRKDESVTLGFDVKDSGIGIPESSLGNIFESFTQASSDTTRKFGGTGLGLTIVKNMIELQGGKIEVKSKPGVGTTFSFNLTFQITEEELTVESTETKKDISISHLRILAVEDNPINQMVIRKTFANWSTELVCADNGKIALEKLRQSEFDIVLMDIQMPVMDGHTASRIIRSDFPERQRNIPIIAMTAHATSLEKQKCYDAGMNDYISKPFNPLELKQKIHRLDKGKNQPVSEKFQESASENSGAEAHRKSEAQSPHTFGNMKSSSSSKHDPFTSALVIEIPALPKPSTNDSSKINLTYLKQIADGNDSFIIEMIELFLNNTPLALEEMRTSYENQNWENVRQIAHKIKPTFTYVGLPETQKALAEIETLSGEAKATPRMTELMNDVNTVCQSAFSQLEIELNRFR